METIPIRVECYAGYREAETPRAVDTGSGRTTVLQIVDRWYEAGREPETAAADYFKVSTADSRLLILKWERSSSAWFLVQEFADHRPGE